MDNICKICDQPVTERKHWWSQHHIKEADYYQKFYENKDLLTGELIPFKNPEQYLTTDFVDKINLKKYLESISNEAAYNYCRSWLGRRKEVKGLKMACSEFELRSLQFPSIKYIEKRFGASSYARMCHELEMEMVFNYNLPLSIDEKMLNFICDTREQRYIKFDNVQIGKLEFGDYTVENDNKDVYIERKSLSDFVNTMSQGYDRFRREATRCYDYGGYLIVVIEEKYTNLMSFPYLPHMRHTQASVDFISHQFREIIKDYPNTIQFLAVDGRPEMKRVMEKIFKCNQNIKKIDLQYKYDIGEL